MERALGARLESGLSSGGTWEPLMVLEQDGEDTGAILLEDGVIGKISYVFRRSLNCFAGTGSQRGRSRSGGSVWILCNNQVRERRRPRGLGGSGGDRGR